MTSCLPNRTARRQPWSPAHFRGLDDETREKLSSLPSNDEVLAAAMRQSRVVLGQSGDRRRIRAAAAQGLPRTGFAAIGPRSEALSGHVSRRCCATSRCSSRPRPAAGLFTIRPERDGIVRRVPLVMAQRGPVVPSLSTELLRVATNARRHPDPRRRRPASSASAVPGFELPTDGNGRVWVYFSQHDPARYVSAKDVLEGTVPPDRFAQRLVLIGTSAIGLLDIKTTPVDAAMPGVEVHAQILETALTQIVSEQSELRDRRSKWPSPSSSASRIIALAPMIGAAGAADRRRARSPPR